MTQQNDASGKEQAENMEPQLRKILDDFEQSSVDIAVGQSVSDFADSFF